MEEPQHFRDPLAAFLGACGVTAVLAETPQNRFAEVETTVDSEPEDLLLAQSDDLDDDLLPPPADEDDAVQAAREVARTAPDVATLHRLLAGFDGCPLKQLARTTCLGEGPVGAPVMFVGEAPGRDEDEAGRPFVGRSGQLLEKMLKAIGLSREAVYISNVIPWRPPANRTPSPIETATCEVFVRREIALVRPKVLVALGGSAAKTLFATDTGIMRQRGHWVTFDADGHPIDAVAMFHPAYLLRTPGEKRRAWQDLLAVRRKLVALGAIT
ncbi:uracil-DNA glycosylase family protein [Acuticoccus sp. I52.16.1]|uniref:uracil-DNA glycosylase n=1 Tax=Acuticoccus sp. I52.16.1 TaxID=2928472 RepID=UPI001FD4C0F3|nr:uracil-DNA glycosylase [Acuticoccus sp. I52.16.1]UOM34464.1 uracil-DNA glycosylase [Acuticoccus sp. I52.16.1]